MKKIKVNVSRKIYLGKYETKLIGGEMEFETDGDWKEEYLDTFNEFSDLIEQVAATEAKKNRERQKKEAEQEREKHKKMAREMIEKSLEKKSK